MWLILLQCNLQCCSVTYIAVVWLTVLQCDLQCCSVTYIATVWITVLQCDLQCCSVTYIAAVWLTGLQFDLQCCSVTYSTAVWLTVLQCDLQYCSVTYSYAVWLTGLQHDLQCCSVTYSAAVVLTAVKSLIVRSPRLTLHIWLSLFSPQINMHSLCKCGGKELQKHRAKIKNWWRCDVSSRRGTSQRWRWWWWPSKDRVVSLNYELCKLDQICWKKFVKWTRVKEKNTL